MHETVPPCNPAILHGEGSSVELLGGSAAAPAQLLAGTVMRAARGAHVRSHWLDLRLLMLFLSSDSSA